LSWLHRFIISNESMYLSLLLTFYLTGGRARHGSDDSEEEAHARKRGATRVDEIEEEEEDDGAEDFV
jgi:hypothetical protein